MQTSYVAYHGVLAHQNDSLSAKSATNLVHLLGADIVNADNENALVLLEEALELVEVAGLVFGLAPHIFFSLKVGCLRVK